MILSELFDYLKKNKVKISLVGENLSIFSEKNKVTTEVKEALKSNKNEIINLLKEFSDYREVIFERENNEEGKPSFSQERMCKFNRFIPNHREYLKTFLAFRLVGNLNVDYLKNSIGKIISKHEVLRSNFLYKDESFKVQVHNEERNFFHEYDLSVKNKEEILKEIYEPFDLENDSLIQVFLLKEKENTYELIIKLSNLITDGWSAKVIFEELKEGYGVDLLTNSNNKVVQYYDYSKKIRDIDYSFEFQEDIDYWKDSLRDVDEKIEFLNTKKRKVSKVFTGENVDFHFNEEITSSLKKICSKEKISLFVVIYTIISIMIYEYSNNKKFVLFVPVVNRDNIALQKVIGLFDNLLMLKNTINDEDLISEIINRNKKTIYDGFEHQSVPFEVVLNELHTIPQFQVQVSMLDKSMKNFELGDIEVETIDFQTKRCICDLEIYFWINEGSIDGHITYSNELFNKETVEDMVNYAVFVARDLLSNYDNNYSSISKRKRFNKDYTEGEKKFINEVCKLIDKEEFNINKTFYELGGHSLSFLKFILLLEKEYGIKKCFENIYNMTIGEIMNLISIGEDSYE